MGDHAKIDKMSMSDLVTTLVTKKLLKREAHQFDKRAYALALTKSGHTKVLKAIPIVEGIDKKFFTKKTESLVKLVKNLRYIID